MLPDFFSFLSVCSGRTSMHQLGPVFQIFRNSNLSWIYLYYHVWRKCLYGHSSYCWKKNQSKAGWEGGCWLFSLHPTLITYTWLAPHRFRDYIHLEADNRFKNDEYQVVHTRTLYLFKHVVYLIINKVRDWLGAPFQWYWVYPMEYILIRRLISQGLLTSSPYLK